ncbi:hypothetical protein M8C21_028399, partial [Ambrosia artemisiifolia]
CLPDIIVNTYVIFEIYDPEEDSEVSLLADVVLQFTLVFSSNEILRHHSGSSRGRP